MRIAFPFIGGGNWTGGYNYLLNLVRALSAYCSDELVPVVFFGEDAREEEILPFAALSGVELVRSAALNQARRNRSLVRALLLGVDVAIRDLLLRHRIDVVFEAAQYFGRRLGIPAIAWLPDFQHRHLPHLFSNFARIKRDLGFRAQMAGGRTLMLSSMAACRDCELFYPAARGRTHVVHFAVPQPRPISIDAARQVALSYGLPEVFLYLPNQFWIHKNHLLVADALALLRQNGRRVVVAATGNTMDSRDPQYYPNLRQRIESLRIGEDFRLLGLVPHDHISALMQASVAVINPSLFEGWSTTVEEARALGVPLILSDLEVHREQMGGDAIYFDRRSSDSLADALAGFRSLSAAQRADRQLRAGVDAQARVRCFTGEFSAVVERCVLEGHI